MALVNPHCGYMFGFTGFCLKEDQMNLLFKEVAVEFNKAANYRNRKNCPNALQLTT